MSLNPQLGAASTITSGALPVTNNANLSLPYASGGGGGPIGPNPSVSSLSVASNGTVIFTTPDNINNAGGIQWNTNAGGTTIDLMGWTGVGDETGTQNTALCTYQGPNPGPGSYFLQNIGVHGVFFGNQTGTGQGAYLQQDPANAGGVYVSSLRVSSINGVAPGGSLFQSTFAAVPCPGNSSTILMEVPAGQYGFNGLIQGGGATSMLSGNVNVLVDQAGPFYFGQINQLVGSQPAGSFPAQMVINQGDSGLSTIKLIVAATGGTSGAFTGVISKLY